MTELVSSSAVRVGAVRGRYFRENFAQGGIDLAQIVPELVTNADAAIAAAAAIAAGSSCASGRPTRRSLARGVSRCARCACRR